jgi:hypothetical protein
MEEKNAAGGATFRHSARTRALRHLKTGGSLDVGLHFLQNR